MTTNVANPWWKDHSARRSPHARWLRFFRRQARLHERSASRLTTPAVTIFTPQHVSLPEVSLHSTPQQLDCVASLASAKNLTVNLIPSAQAENGSVTLIGVLLNKEPGLRLTFPPPSSEDQHIPSRTRLPMVSQLPLWKRLAYLMQPPTDLLLAQDGPLEWPGTLFPYQLQGIHALMTHDALLLADDMGLGKTIQAITALRLLVLQRQVETALVIVRAGLMNQWRKELQRWAPELRVSTVRGPAIERAWQWSTAAHVYLVSYETFRADFTDNPHSPPRRRVWDVMILDEAQAIKNRDAEISSKC